MARNALPLDPPPRTLFVMRFSALGDVAHMIPVVRSVRAHWPKTRITWCVGSLEHRLVGDLPGIEFLVFDKSRGASAYTGLRARLKGRRFDVLVHAQVSLRANLASLAVRAPIRLGYDRARARDLHGLFVNRRIPPGHGQHVIEGFFSFARALGVPEARPWRWDIPVPEDARAFARRQIPDHEPTAIISPCSSHPLRNWPADRYAAVADELIGTYRRRVILCGGPTGAERAMGEAICARMRARPLNLIGRDTVKGLVALLSRAELLIAPDSGPMHIATGVGTPVVGLHAASNPARSGPYFSRQWCVDRYDAAARKYLGKAAAEIPWGTKIEKPGVMSLVAVDDVLERLRRFYAQATARPLSPGNCPQNQETSA